MHFAHSTPVRWFLRAAVIVGILVWIVGPTQAAKFSETIAVVVGTGGGIVTGDAPVLVESWGAGYNLDANSDGSLFGPGIRPDAPPAEPAPVPNIPPGIAAQPQP
jgi:hypothetical protein